MNPSLLSSSVSLCATTILLLVLGVTNSYAEEPFTDTQTKTAQSLMQQALKSELAYEIVESLTTEVGPRLGGSEAEKTRSTMGQGLG